MSREEYRGASASAQAGDSEIPRSPSASGMSGYSQTSAADSPRDEEFLGSAEGLPPSADDGWQPGHTEKYDDVARAGLASRNSDERGRKRKHSRQAAEERAGSATRTQPQAQVDRKRRSDGVDDD